MRFSPAQFSGFCCVQARGTVISNDRHTSYFPSFVPAATTITTIAFFSSLSLSLHITPHPPHSSLPFPHRISILPSPQHFPSSPPLLIIFSPCLPLNLSPSVPSLPKLFPVLSILLHHHYFSVPGTLSIILLL